MIDFVRVQDVGLSGRPDTEVLEFAAAQGRILLTHDAASMVDAAFVRIAEGRAMPGVIVAIKLATIGQILEDLVLILTASDESDWVNTVRYIPFR